MPPGWTELLAESSSSSLESAALAEKLLYGGILLALAFLVGLFFGTRRRRASSGVLEDDQEVTGLVPPAEIVPGLHGTMESSSGGGVVQAEARVVSAEGNAILLETVGNPLVTSVGAPVRIVLACGEAAIRFHSTVQDFRALPDKRLYHVKKPSWAERLQRRDNFRVRVAMPTLLTPVQKDGGEAPSYRGQVEDLSATGIRIATPSEISPGAIVRFRLPIPEMGEPIMEARVVRSGQGRSDGFPYRIHAEFLHIPDETRNLILGHCNEVQRRVMRARRTG